MTGNSECSGGYQHQYRNCLLANLALEKSAGNPDGIAIYLENQPPITFGSIVDEACRLAGGLRELGLVRGDVISFQLPNWREAVAIDIAASPSRSGQNGL